jgi:hypothetical protein
MTAFNFTASTKVQCDSRTYYPNKPLAQTAANRGQKEFEDQGVFSAVAQFVPDKGYVAVLFSEKNIPEAWEGGFEVRTTEEMNSKAATPSDWASPKKAKPAASPASPSGAATPSPKGATGKVWEIASAMHAETPLQRSDRPRVIAACEEAGINKATAATQWSKWAKANGV